MRASTITPELIDRMVELRQDGWTISAIARKLAVSRPTVAKHLQRHDADLVGEFTGERGALVTSTAWLLLPPARLRLQLAAEGR
jgi:orotate phosphoribosyltransferase-like protein